MSTIKLLQPILEGGIQRTNFFNGRILTAADMKKEQEACSKANSRTNIAAGEGVIHGLEVKAGGTMDDPIVFIDPGMAVSRSGSILHLDHQVDFKVIPHNEEIVTEEPIFSECNVQVNFPTGIGVYVLVISPASDYEEYIPINNFAVGRSSNCGLKYITEGIQFKLVKIGSSLLFSSSLSSELAQSMDGIEDMKVNLTRNLLSHLCFGTKEKRDFPEDPFFDYSEHIPDRIYGLIEVMRKNKYLNDGDVPLALLYWTSDKLSFLDMWSVRRKRIPMSPAGNWHLFLGKRNPAESEACFLQFQEHLDHFIEKNQYSISARQYFRFMPSFGIIPVQGSYIQNYMNEFGDRKYMQDLANNRIYFSNKPGFQPLTFFNEITIRQPVIIEGSKFEAAMRESLSYPPIDTKGGEFLWLYLIRENLESVFKGEGSPYLIFTGGYLPYIGDARYDLSRWDLSNFSSGKD